jgi:hypothetical protein
MTPPASWTEQHDGNFQNAAGTLQQSIATRDPATGAAGTFTSTQTNWQHGLGTHVIIKGSGPTSPSFRSISTAQQVVTGRTATVSISKPSGVVAGDVLLVFVSLGVSGGLVPTGWLTPPGFNMLGANFATTGSGSTQSTLAVGVWAKLAGGSEPSTYETTINLPTGTKLVHAAMVAIQNPFLVPGGVQIRLAGKPMRRLLAYTELQAPSQTLCDFQNIPQGYDNLELVYDTTSDQNGDTLNRRIKLNYNGDATNVYFHRIIQDGVDVSGSGAPSSRILLGAINGQASGSRAAGSINIYGYARVGKPVSLGHAWWVATGPVAHDEEMSGQYDGASAISRIVVAIDAGTVRFATGSRAYLYGY